MKRVSAHFLLTFSYEKEGFVKLITVERGKPFPEWKVTFASRDRLSVHFQLTAKSERRAVLFEKLPFAALS